MNTNCSHRLSYQSFPNHHGDIMLPEPISYFHIASLCLGLDSPDDLCVLYSNRAACYLKDGNSQDCIQDCTK